MARRRSTTSAQRDELPENFTEHIVDIDVTREMETSFLEYSYSVIYSRALPDARDGLKPVQRRILFMMDQMGLRPDRGHVKSARVVGEVMGKLHPHGDAAIYDAMVRLAQAFAMRLPLVAGHGNFGSLDDGPAAPRYTEARMAPAAQALTGDLDEDVVDFVPNYDNQFRQPGVLPAAYPNLLVNGATGIAVGMATNMAPHNLREVTAGARHLVLNPDATLEDLMRFVPGPDLPSGGRIVGLEGIRDAYRTGRGSFKTRATVSVEQVSARKQGIVVTELPHMVGPEKVTEKIKDAVQSKKLSGISDVVDLTDRAHGLRLVIELKNGFNPQAVLAQLYKHTPLEESFGINNVALVDGQPHTMGLADMLRVYTEHRLAVVRRRTSFRLTKRQDRLHLVEGLLVAIVDIDEVIGIIRSSEETSEARERLMTVFDLSRAQADHILELRLRQLTKFSRIELEAERDRLLREIGELEGILGSQDALRRVVADELEVTADTYGDERRTVLLEAEDVPPVRSAARASGEPAPAAPLSLEISDDPCWVFVSTTGRIGRTAQRTPLADGSRRFKHDALSAVVAGTARGEIAAVTSAGRMLRLSCVDIPVLPDFTGVPRLADGVVAADFLGLPKGEALVGLVGLNRVFALGTAHGAVKRVNPEYPLNLDEWPAVKLKAGDTVIGAGACPEDAELVFVSSDAKLLRFPAAAVRPQGRNGGGVAGMKLAGGERAIFFGAVRAQDSVVVTQARGDAQLPSMGEASVKVTPLSEYPVKGRATAGVRAHRFLAGERELNLAWVGHGPGRAVSAAGVARSLPTEYGRRDGSGVAVDRPVAAVGPALAGLQLPGAEPARGEREDGAEGDTPGGA